MRKVLSYITIAVAAALVSSCMDFNVNLVEPQGPAKVTLQLRNADLVATRAVTEDNAFNEDLLVNAQCFFTATDSDVVLYATDLLTIGANQTKTLDIEIPAEKITSLFGTTTKCDVYVVANYGSKITDSSIATIKGKAITLGTGATQDSFVMDGEAEVTLDGTALSGTVDLNRAAAKIVVKANIISSVSEGGKNWLPSTSKIKLTYTGSVNGSKISARQTDANAATEVSYTQETNVFSSFTSETESDGTTKHVGYQATPFYSFPVAAAANEGSIKMVIPWTPAGGTEIEYTYQIPVNIALERNHVYIIEVDVETLGNLDGATLTPSYTVVNWTENAITAGLSRPKYLVVEETQVVMNNVNSYSIPYASSDAVSAVITSISKPNLKTIPVSTISIYNNAEGGESVTPDSSIQGNKNPFAVSVQNGNIVFTHTLINDSTQKNTYDYIPYTITVEVTNQSGFTETITIVQYPAMYIGADLNSGYSATSGDLGKKGYVIINNNTAQTRTWNVVNGLGSGSGSSSSPYMYVVTVTYFDNNDYIIADPRGDIQTSFGFTAQSDVDGDKLTKYRQTQVGDEYENFIAPKFRICSGYGRLGSVALSAATARYRCASYQEDGYPAGRWRVPTSAELKFIGKLCAEGKIPPLFSDGVSYWSASAGFEYSTNGTFSEQNSANYVRCVYDEWYWGSERVVDSDKFTWRDDYSN